tara:strand:+ start:72 stop:194 length:123 start_codon:yes stop_codon:yes gene_type:complete
MGLLMVGAESHIEERKQTTNDALKRCTTNMYKQRLMLVEA